MTPMKPMKPKLGMFKGKETKGEEMKEAKAVKAGKITPKQYAAGEKKEGHGAGAMKKGMALKAGKLSPAKYAAQHDNKKAFMDRLKNAKAKKLATTTTSAPAPTAPAAPAMKKGGCVKKYARGGGIEVRGKTRGRII